MFFVFCFLGGDFIKIYIMRNETVFQVNAIENVNLSLYKSGVAGCLKFDLLGDDIEFTEGDAVKFVVDDTDLFLGFIFSLNYSKNKVISITAYDQLRYFKNKDTYLYSNKTASELLCEIAQDFNCNVGEIEDTGYIIPYRIEDNNTLFDIVQTGLDLTFENTNQQYILYDDCGKLSLKNIFNMLVNIVICEDTIEDYVMTSTIDKDSFNKIKLIYENNKTGARDIYTLTGAYSQWGVLQYVDYLKEGENGVQKAIAMHKIYCKKTKTLTILNALGDVRVRGGSLLIVDMPTINQLKLMMVKSVTHTFKNNEHFMKLSLIGGEFDG